MEYTRCMEMDALTLVQSLFHWQATILMLITMGMKLCGKVRNKFALSQLWKGCTENEFTCSSGLCVDMEKRWLGLLNEQWKNIKKTLDVTRRQTATTRPTRHLAKLSISILNNIWKKVFLENQQKRPWSMKTLVVLLDSYFLIEFLWVQTR